MKVVEIIGARPQFVKAATVSRVLRKSGTDILVHTGQHYDENMSRVFFDELEIPRPDYDLEVGSGTHGEMTAKMLERIEEVLVKEKPDMVLVYGDTNSTIAGSLAAVKLHIPTAHVEAGLRSFNREMPEEINRILTDHASDLLFVPTQVAVENLKKEGITKGVHLTGDCMYDALLHAKALSADRTILKDLGLEADDYLLATVHRASNTDDERLLRNIFEAFAESPTQIVLPLHPRTKKMVQTFGVDTTGVKIIEPVGYLDFVALEASCNGILTDSGGIQKEAFLLGKRCITMREETEWVETVDDGWNILVGPDKGKILDAISNFHPTRERSEPYGDGRAAEKMVQIMLDF